MKLLNVMFLFSVALGTLNLIHFFVEPKYTYIQDIDLPTPLKLRVSEFLTEVDPKLHGMFTRKSLRPVTIELGLLDDSKMAESEITPFYCRIVLNESFTDLYLSNELKLRTTILHELGHCFGFWQHDSDPSSVMYWADNGLIDQNSIDKFLIRLNARGNL